MIIDMVRFKFMILFIIYLSQLTLLLFLLFLMSFEILYFMIFISFVVLIPIPGSPDVQCHEDHLFQVFCQT